MAFPEFRQSITGKGSSPEASSILAILSKFFFFYASSSLVAPSARRVGFFNIGSGQELDKIPDSGSGSGQVGVSKYTIGYFRVSFLLSGILGYFRYFQVCRFVTGIYR